MRKNRELMPKDLKASCNPDMFKIGTTKEIEDCSDLVYGQERGIAYMALRKAGISKNDAKRRNNH